MPVRAFDPLVSDLSEIRPQGRPVNGWYGLVSIGLYQGGLTICFPSAGGISQIATHEGAPACRC